MDMQEKLEAICTNKVASRQIIKQLICLSSRKMISKHWIVSHGEKEGCGGKGWQIQRDLWSFGIYTHPGVHSLIADELCQGNWLTYCHWIKVCTLLFCRGLQANLTAETTGCTHLPLSPVSWPTLPGLNKCKLVDRSFLLKLARSETSLLPSTN